jgi:amino acid efflux transporter
VPNVTDRAQSHERVHLDGAAGGRVGVVRASALYVAAVLGTGILVLPGLAAAAAGPASILSVGAVFLLSIPLAGTFASLAARFPDAGGVATFVRLAIGPTAARMAGYWFLFGVQFGAPVVATLGGEYVVAALGADRLWVPMLSIAFLLIPFTVNLFGVRISGGVQVLLSGLLVVLVVGVIVVATPVIEPGNFTPFLPNGWWGVGIAINLFVWAFAGWEAVTHLASEFRNPRRTIPLATAIAIVIVGVAYLSLQIVTVGALGSGTPDSQVPLIDLVALTVPGVGPVVVAVVAAIMAVGVLNAYIPAFANLAASLGRDGHLPRFFAKGAEGGRVPRRALVLTIVIELSYFAFAAVVLRMELAPLILIHTSNMVAVYALGMVAAVLLLERWSVGWWLAVIATVMVAGLLMLAGPNLLVASVLALIAIVVTIVKRLRSSRRHS